MLMVDDRTDDVRPVKAIAAAAVIIFATVVEGKGLAALQVTPYYRSPSHSSTPAWNRPSAAIRS